MSKQEPKVVLGPGAKGDPERPGLTHLEAMEDRELKKELDPELAAELEAKAQAAKEAAKAAKEAEEADRG